MIYNSEKVIAESCELNKLEISCTQKGCFLSLKDRFDDVGYCKPFHRLISINIHNKFPTFLHNKIPRERERYHFTY